MTTYYTYLPSPVGPFLLAGNERALSYTSFTTGHQQRRPPSNWKKDSMPLANAVEQFTAYFEGQPLVFDLVLAPQGTSFQCAVWKVLQSIPFGQTRSYGEVAALMGNPGAARAIGAANAANHLPVVIPCHRVIGSDKSLTGFGGGLEAKACLLRLEGISFIEDQDQDQLKLI